MASTIVAGNLVESCVLVAGKLRVLVAVNLVEQVED
jgi:hypothetical protein